MIVYLTYFTIRIAWYTNNSNNDDYIENYNHHNNNNHNNDSNNNTINNYSSNSRTAAHDDVDGNKVAHVVKATKQERGETLGRIAVRTAYDPWELLDVLTQAKGTNPSQRDCIQPAPSYILKTRTPQYDLIIIDCLYPVLSPYINITVPDLKSVSMSGTVGLLGTYLAGLSRDQFRESVSPFCYAIKCLELNIMNILFPIIFYYFWNLPCYGLLWDAVLGCAVIW